LSEPSAWADAVTACALLAIDPAGLGGMAVRAQAGPVRDRLLALLPGRPRRMPPGIADDALLGGLDLAATLRGGAPVRTRGLLAELAGGGVLLATMAERMPPALAGRLAAALDGGAGFAVVALDEGIEADERTRPALLDRLAFHADLAALGHRDATEGLPDAGALAAARGLLPAADQEDGLVDALCGAALALGIDSPRAPLLALRAARAAACLAGRSTAIAEDAALAARLVLSPRATRIPQSAESETREAPPEADPPDAAHEPPPDMEPPRGDAGADDQVGEADLSATSALVLDAARAAIPPGLLARLRAQDFRGAAGRAGQEGARQKGARRGRPVGVRAAAPGPGLRMNLVETLRAAAPWQRVRARGADRPGRIQLRREDFRVTRTEQRARSTTIFVVDASGSAALNRLAEAKGAVELLLADCYRRRDEVAVLAFRGRGAQVLLAPTRSLVRARRSLASLPGGGGTPLAAGLEAGLKLAEAVRRAGATPTLVVLTDGRANVTRAGTGGRAQAAQDGLAAARRLRAAGIASLLLDTSPRPGPEAGRLAQAMGALYVPLPYADARGVVGAVRAARA
jgi:magnesium chelatase subunit D